MAELNQVHPMESTALDPKKTQSHYPFDNQDYGSPYKYEQDFKGPIK